MACLKLRRTKAIQIEITEMARKNFVEMMDQKIAPQKQIKSRPTMGSNRFLFCIYDYIQQDPDFLQRL